MKKSYQFLRIGICFAACLCMLQSFYVNDTITETISYGQQVTNNLLASATGLCFMLSGRFLLEEYEVGIGTFYKKRLMRLLPPFLICSLLSLISQIGFSVSLGFAKDYFKRIASGSMEQNYWIVYSMIGFYLMAPFFARMLSRLETKEKKGLIILLLGYFLFFNLGVLFQYRIAVSSYPFLNWTCYALLGYLIEHIGLSKKNQIVGAWIGLVCFVISCTECIFFAGRNWSLDSYCLSRAGICIGIFLLVGFFEQKVQQKKGEKQTESQMKNQIKIQNKKTFLDHIAYSAYFAYLFLPVELRVLQKKGIACKQFLFTIALFALGIMIGMLWNFVFDWVLSIFTKKDSINLAAIDGNHKKARKRHE